MAALLATISLDARAADWRYAMVRSITTLDEVDDVVNQDCAPARPDQPRGRVMVVTFGVGKSLRWRAINLSEDDRFELGEVVRMDPVACRVRPAIPPAAASAP